MVSHSTGAVATDLKNGDTQIQDSSITLPHFVRGKTNCYVLLIRADSSRTIQRQTGRGATLISRGSCRVRRRKSGNLSRALGSLDSRRLSAAEPGRPTQPSHAHSQTPV